MLRSLAIGLTFLLFACGNSERPTSTPEHKAISRPIARLAVVTDLQGQLEPCGCQSRPLGGIDRMATEIEKLRADGVPTFVLFAGDLLFGAGDGHAPDPNASQQEHWRAETLVAVLNKIGVSAVNPGASDWNHDPELVEPLLSQLSAHKLSTRPRQDAPPASSHLLEAAGVKVGTVGIFVDPQAEPPANLPATVAGAARSLRAGGAVIVVALVSGERRVANQLARVAGIDFVVSAGIDAAQPSAPAQAGSAYVLSAARHGEGLVAVDIHRSGDGPLSDASPWSRERDQQALTRSIEELRAKIAAWEQQTADRALVAEQKARLAALEQQRSTDTVATNGNHFVARWREIGPEVARNAEIEGLLDAYDHRVNEHNRVAFAAVKAPEPAAGQPRYVGSAACQTCHQRAYAWWTEHPHGRAYATLEALHKEFNLSCVGCHVTGYNRPGGSTVVQNQGLTNVGCESCHGPGSAHVADPDEEPYSVQRVVPANVCVDCHNAEHSDKFDYRTYREKLLVPGHGRSGVAAP